MRVPEGFMREKSKQRIENYALENGHSEITLETAEAGLVAARQAMEQAMGGEDQGSTATKPALQPGTAANTTQSKCPFAKMMKQGQDQASENQAPELSWQQKARDRLRGIPRGFCR